MTSPQAESLPQRKGRAFHALMEAWALLETDAALSPEQILQQPVWARLLAAFSLSRPHLLEVVEAAQRLLGHSQIRDWIGLAPPQSLPAPQRWSEREWLTPDGRRLRPDCVLAWPAPQARVRIIDWKWAVLQSERSDYAQQLADYQALMAHHLPGQVIEASVVTAKGEIWHLSDQGLVHWMPAGRPAL